METFLSFYNFDHRYDWYDLIFRRQIRSTKFNTGIQQRLQDLVTIYALLEHLDSLF